MTHVKDATTVAANGPPPHDAAAFYVGEVMHARLKPVGHRFSYRVFCLLVDLDRLGEAAGLSRLFSVDRFNLLAFHQKDFGDGSGDLRGWVDRRLAAAGLAERADRVVLLAYPRVVGTLFNPIAVYFAYGRDGTLAAAIYEVRNTFGEKHAYVAKVEDGEMSPAGLRQERDKRFYVSPFIEMAMRYRFRVLPPGEAVRVRILEDDRDGPLLAATFAGTYAAMTTRGTLRLLAAIPWLTAKVVGGIHYEALKLWLKRVPFHHRPAHPGPVSYGDEHQGLDQTPPPGGMMPHVSPRRPAPISTRSIKKNQERTA